MQSQIFERYIGIDYSGAETPTSSLKGLRVYSATNEDNPSEVQPPPSPRKYWTRNGTLSSFFNPPLRHVERIAAQIEGWILGIKRTML